jgi:aminomethyltransferase
MPELKRTVLYERHVRAGAQMVEFGGWDMPVMYPGGIIEEHLATRKGAGLFDVSHMGRFFFHGPGAVAFLQHALSNNAQALDPRYKGAQYTFIPNPQGGAVDDAYLYRFTDDEYLLVVNASNRDKDWAHLQALLDGFSGVSMVDGSDDWAMLSLQGPDSRAILNRILQSGRMPETARNSLSMAVIDGMPVKIARTGYTGEPLGFELFVSQGHALPIWDRLIAEGARPIGLGARDTLRLEAGLPLYGHELGVDIDGNEIPIFACPLARFGVSFSELKKDFVGRTELARQQAAFQRILFRDYSRMNDLPRQIKFVAVAGRGVARQGSRVYKAGQPVGYVTSGTMVPLWKFEGEGLFSQRKEERQMRSICIAYLHSDLLDQEPVTIDIRGKEVEAVVVPCHMRSESPPHARPILYDYRLPPKALETADRPQQALNLLFKAVDNTLWRQKECINLIPSEMTPSPLVRMLSIMDPAFRYAEHKKVGAFYDAEVYYYQGTDFISEVENRLVAELKKYTGGAEVETRLISGQMANTAVFSAMLDYLNRGDRRQEPRRIRKVMNHHIGKGGHLSSQPMGALKDYVARDAQTEGPAIINFPVLPENAFKVDVPKTLDLIAEHRPELIVFGKSMILSKEPVSAVRRFLDEQRIDAVVMYDMAHVLGLIGPHFQQPFLEGADLVTGSTHKTFFGTQRGIAAGRFQEGEERYELWKAIERRTFPGAVSNHHLGTLLGLLFATYEMNHFKEAYQKAVIANAKAFARALKTCGFDVAGDPQDDFTETHQVVVRVGYARGAEIARRLEDSHIVCNYQAGPEDESFSASGALRMGVSEMTRFGMAAGDFEKLAEMMHDVLAHGKNLREEVVLFRKRFCALQYTFTGQDYDKMMSQLAATLMA